MKEVLKVNNKQNDIKSLSPLIKYSGGKSRELSQYYRYIPTMQRYFEPFLGGGATFFKLAPQDSYIADINKPLIQFYKSFRDEYPRVRKELDSLHLKYVQNHNIFEARKSAHPDNHAENPNERLYYSIRDMFNGLKPSPYAYGTLYFFINKLAYSGMIRYNRAGEFNVPYGWYANFNTKLATTAHQKLLSKSEIVNESYEHSFDLAGPNDFIFLDPPYDTTFSDYGNEVFTGDFNEDSHRKLAADFKNLNAPALMIIGNTPLVSDLYQKYIQGSYKKSYSVNIRNRFKSSAEHLIIANYKINDIYKPDQESFTQS